MEDEQEQKQQFLRKEILDENYDPQAFINFLTDSGILNMLVPSIFTIIIQFSI